MTAGPIVVCLKPVLQTHVPLRLAAGGTALRPEDILPAPNPADLTALVTALRLRERPGAEPVRVVVLTVGPAAWEEPLRLALGAGADAAVRVAWPSRAEWPAPDGSAVTTACAARAAARALAELAPVLVLTGDGSADAAHGCFAAFVAHGLGLPLAHGAQTLTRRGETWEARVRLERGYTQEVVLPAPAVVSMAAGMERLPPADLPRWVWARAAAIAVVTPAEPAPVPPPTHLRVPRPRVRPYRVPDPDLPPEERIAVMLASPEGRAGRILTAEVGPDAQAAEAARLLKERGYG